MSVGAQKILVWSNNSSFEDYLTYSLEQSITDTAAKILIIDNLTYLKNETEFI